VKGGLGHCGLLRPPELRAVGPDASQDHSYLARNGNLGLRCADMMAELDRTGEDQISLTDPDSRAMAAHTHVGVGYNVQIAVDTEHKLIVEQQVTNQVIDLGLLTKAAEPAKEILGVETISVVADKGYFKIEDIEACENAGILPYVPRPQRGPSVRAGLFRKDEFSYDADSDRYLARPVNDYMPIPALSCAA
jgi:hypothetical protein